MASGASGSTTGQPIAPVRRALAARDSRLRRAGVRRRACSRRSWAARRSACGASSTRRSRSPTTSTRRSSSSPGCRACSRRRSSAARSPRPASCSRRCSGTRWRRRSRSASRRVRRSARCWRSRSAARWRCRRSSACRSRASPGRSAAVAHRVHAGDARGIAASRRTCMLLAGVTMNSFFSAVILFVQYFADMSQTMRALRWLMGDLDVAGYAPILAALPLGARGVRVFAWLPRSLNLLALGDGPGRGARRRRAPGAAPRVLQRVARDGRRRVARRARRLHRHRRAAPGAAAGRRGPSRRAPRVALFGAAFLVGCDLVARTVMAPIELPVGIVTAMIGGPFFLWLLIRRA